MGKGNSNHTRICYTFSSFSFVCLFVFLFSLFRFGSEFVCNKCEVWNRVSVLVSLYFQTLGHSLLQHLSFLFFQLEPRIHFSDFLEGVCHQVLQIITQIKIRHFDLVLHKHAFIPGVSKH